MHKTKVLNKILTVLMIAVILSFCLNVIAFAADEAIDTETEVVEPTPGAESETVAPTPEEPKNGFDMFIDTVKVLVGDKMAQTVNMGVNIILLIIMAIFKKSNNVTLTDITKSITLKDATGKTYPISAVVKQLADIADKNTEDIKTFKEEIGSKLNTVIEQYAKNTATHDQVSEALVATKAFLEMIHTIYSRSKTISDPTKQQIELIYTAAMRQINALEERDSDDSKA